MSGTRVVLIGSEYVSVASGATMIYQAVMLDTSGVPINGANLLSLTLSLIDTESGSIVNGVDQTNILNTGRGTINATGNLQIILGTVPDVLDTTLFNADDQVEVRSMVIDWVLGVATGRHQVDFQIIALSGP